MEKFYNKNYFNIDSVKNILSKHINKIYYGHDIKLNIIKKHWKTIIGESLFNETAPVKLYKTTLYVNCTHPSMINALHFNKDVILNKLNNVCNDLVEVNELIIKRGPLVIDQIK